MKKSALNQEKFRVQARRAAWGFLCLMLGLAQILHAADGGAQPGAPGPARGDAATSPTVRRPQPKLWDASLNGANSFSNLGIDTYYHKTINSKAGNFNGQPETEVGYVIYLPPDYDATDTRFPVLYFLHGMGGNENTAAPVVKAADNLIKNGDLPPFIIAAANCGLSFYGNQFEGKYQAYDFYFQEFIPHIDATYRTAADREHRNIQGFSMGGYGAAMFAMKHPDLFGAVTEIGGALAAARSHNWAEMYNSSEENYRPFDLWVLPEENKEAIKDLKIAMWIGSEDITRATNEQFHAKLVELNIEHTYNDWNNHPELEGVPHNLARYYELYGEEILKFHTDAFGAVAASE